MTQTAPITILLASFNGAQHLAEQLDSIAAQQHDGWRLIVSDDGSQDETRAICTAFRDRMGPDRVQLIEGPGKGPTRNFLHLIDQAPGDVPLAFADQDDIWLPQKLTRAASHLADDAGPLLYCARTLICDAQLQNRKPSRLFARPHGWRNALVQACTPGNTTVLNQAAATLLKRSVQVAERHDLTAHDWWAYLVVTGAGGRVIFDGEPGLLYRQHENNVMGRNDTPHGMVRRMTLLMQGDYGGWLAKNADALAALPGLLTDENREILMRFQAMLRMSGPVALREMIRLGLYRQTSSGDMALKLAALSGRLRRAD